MRRLAGLLLIVAACAAKTDRADRSACERQAEGRYRECTHPQYFSEGEQAELPDSQETQACERAYHQALNNCAGHDSDVLPAIDLSRTSSSS